MEEDNVAEESQSVEPAKGGRGNWLAVAAVLIVAIIILSTLVWSAFFMYSSVRILATERFEPGDSVRISGTVTDIDCFENNYETYYMLTLDDFNLVQLATNDSGYEVGDTYRTTLEFEEYNFNGNKLVGAPGLVESYMVLPAAMGIVIDAVSYVYGYYLNLSSSSDGVIEYTVLKTGNETPAQDYNITLRRGLDFGEDRFDNTDYPYLFSYEYINVISDFYNWYNYEYWAMATAGAEFDIDFMASLADGISENGMIEYEDTDSDGLLSSGDIIRVNLPPTLDDNRINSYMLYINDGIDDGTHPIGEKYILNWYDGAFISMDDPSPMNP